MELRAPEGVLFYGVPFCYEDRASLALLDDGFI